MFVLVGQNLVMKKDVSANYPNIANLVDTIIMTNKRQLSPFICTH